MSRRSCRDRASHTRLARPGMPATRLVRMAMAGVALLAGIYTTSSLHAAQQQPYTAAAMWRLKRLDAPSISPDGRLAVVPVTGFDAASDMATTELWLVPTKPGKARRLTSGSSSDITPAWSPDGEQIAFVSKRGHDKEPQLYVIAVNGGEAKRVTNLPTGASAPKWFPNSRRLAFLSRVWSDLDSWNAMASRLKKRSESTMTAKAWDKAPIAHWDHFLDDRQTHAYFVDINGAAEAVGEPQAITLGSGRALDCGDPDTTCYDISPDGGEIAFVSNVDASGSEPNFDIFVLPIGSAPSDSSMVRSIAGDDTTHDTAPLYSPDGRTLAFQRRGIKSPHSDDARLMLFDRRNAQLRSLTDDWDRSADGLVWSPDSGALFGAIDDAGSRRIYRFDISGSPPKAITRDYSYHALAIAGSGPVIVALRQSFAEPPTLVSIIARTGAATKLTDFNDRALANLAQGRFESVTYQGARGEDVQMWVIYPPDFTPERKWPLYLLLHGGPHDAMINSYQWGWNAQIFASWGYVAAWPNFHGSSGFGQDWAGSITEELAELPYEDTIRAADWFVAQPWIDAERLAAGGAGYGGYLASVLLGRTQPFKTLVAHAAIYDLYAQYGSDHGAQRWHHAEYWEDPERFMRNSPNLAAANFKTPTLITHGQLDQRSPVIHGIALFNTLQKRGIPSKLMYFPDEGHWILKPRNSLFWYDGMHAWLERHVQHDTGPVDAPTRQPPLLMPRDGAGQTGKTQPAVP